MNPAAPLALGLLPRTATVDADGRLAIDGCDLELLALEHGTPLYVYSETELRARAREYGDAFGADAVSYAGKAFLCSAMARLVADEGLHLDVATGGELEVALHAGFPAARIVFHGNNKSEAELQLALDTGVGRIVADSFDELDRIEALVGAGAAPRACLVRVTPGVEAHTHEYIATGADDSKFGFTVSNGSARDAALRVAKSEAMHLGGFHCHIGSQILVLESFARAAAVVAELAADVTRATGTPVPEINLGGGLGVPYTADELDAPSIAEFGRETCANYADACAVLRARSSAGAHGGGGPLGRRTRRGDALHGRHHQGDRRGAHLRRGRRRDERQPASGDLRRGLRSRAARARTAPRPFVATVAGKHCEQGDLLVRDADLPADVAVGDVLVTPVTGAYGYSMASNYNLVPRPAVVFVRDGRARVVVRRETIADLVARDVVDGPAGEGD